MARSSFRQHYREHAQRIQANQFKWPLKVSLYCCKQQPQKKNPKLFSMQAALAVATHCSGNNSCPCTRSSTPLGKVVSARLETAAWYMASQLVSGTASESTEWIWLLWFQALSGSPALVQKPAPPAATANKEPGNTAVKNCFPCVC